MVQKSHIEKRKVSEASVQKGTHIYLQKFFGPFHNQPTLNLSYEFAFPKIHFLNLLFQTYLSLITFPPENSTKLSHFSQIKQSVDEKSENSAFL